MGAYELLIFVWATSHQIALNGSRGTSTKGKGVVEVFAVRREDVKVLKTV